MSLGAGRETILAVHLRHEVGYLFHWRPLSLLWQGLGIYAMRGAFAGRMPFREPAPGLVSWVKRHR